MCGIVLPAIRLDCGWQKRVPGMRFLVVIFSFFCSVAVTNADDCTALLQHGIYDTYRSANLGAKAQDIRNHLCTSNSSTNSNSTNATLNVNAIGYGNGGATYSASQTQAIYNAMCSDGSSISSDTQTANTYTQIIDRTAVAAWQQCVSLSQEGLHVKTTYSEDSQDEMTIAVYYTAPGTSSPHYIRGVSWLHPNDQNPNGKLACVGHLWDNGNAKGGVALGSIVQGMTCSRAVVADAKNAFLSGGKKVLAAESRIMIETDTEIVVREFAAMPVPESAPDSPVPIGAIIDFYAYPGTTFPANFVLCDGKKILSGPLVGQSTPDLREQVTIGASQPSDMGATGGLAQVRIPLPDHAHRLVSNDSSSPGFYGIMGSGTNFFDAKTLAQEGGPGWFVDVPTMPPYVTVYKIMRFK
jgi:hypothetical protein